MGTIVPATSPAQVLHRAVAAIREGQEGYSPDYQDGFLLAVARWLEHTARLVDAVPDGVDPATPERLYSNAFYVARAYLGEA